MRWFHRLAVGFVGLSLALAGGATGWLTSTEGAAASAKFAPPNQQPFGSGLIFHTQLDPNFCLTDLPAPAQPASEASISQCRVEPSQQWTLAHAQGGSVVIIGGESGRCLDFSAKAPTFAAMANCTFSTAEHFYFTSKGQIESTSGTKCLEAEQAAQDAQVFVVACHKNTPLQVWELSH
jgi:hypothetical protein